MEDLKFTTMSRSPLWPRAEKSHIQHQPHCQACKPGTNLDFKVQVHHIFPFHYCIALGRPDLELDDRNLITLCETEADHPSDNHHLLIGHLGDFKEGNLHVVKDCLRYRGDHGDFIKGLKSWVLEVHIGRLKALDLMTSDEKAELRHLMDVTFPQR